MEKEVQLGQVRPSPPRVGAKVEVLSPEDNLVPFPARQATPARYLPPPPRKHKFYFAIVDALLPSEELGEGQLRLSFCGVGRTRVVPLSVLLGGVLLHL
jgi:hypothetical protein